VAKSTTSFEPNNQAAAKHGGEGALFSIKTGTKLTGPARDAEQAVYAELATEGRASIVVRNAARLQAAADLFWNALIAAGEKGDLQAINTYTARFGWLSQAALRAWAQVAIEQKTADDGSIEAAISSAREAKQ
jgi:hypothetical protein